LAAPTLTVAIEIHSSPDSRARSSASPFYSESCTPLFRVLGVFRYDRPKRGQEQRLSWNARFTALSRTFGITAFWRFGLVGSVPGNPEPHVTTDGECAFSIPSLRKHPSPRGQLIQAKTPVPSSLREGIAQPAKWRARNARKPWSRSRRPVSHIPQPSRGGMVNKLVLINRSRRQLLLLRANSSAGAKQVGIGKGPQSFPQADSSPARCVRESWQPGPEARNSPPRIPSFHPKRARKAEVDQVQTKSLGIFATATNVAPPPAAPAAESPSQYSRRDRRQWPHGSIRENSTVAAPSEYHR